MKSKTILKKSLAMLAVSAALGIASTGASAAFPDFQITEGNPLSTPGSVLQSFTADKFIGNYVERITFNGDGTFDVSLRWIAADILSNDGVDGTPHQLRGSSTGGSADQYRLYALFQGSGTVSSSGGTTTFTTTPGGSLQVFTDPLSNTLFGPTPATGADPWTTTAPSNVDDILIATGTAVAGGGTLVPGCTGGINCGSFGTTTSFNLTTAGETYFTQPIPFYNLSFQSGQFNTFTPTGTQTINGSMDVVFGQVPEPTTLALLGIALAGLGFSRRRS
jgi:hypothetical protein